VRLVKITFLSNSIVVDTLFPDLEDFATSLSFPEIGFQSHFMGFSESLTYTNVKSNSFPLLGLLQILANLPQFCR
jgi:hypothetical protein